MSTGLGSSKKGSKTPDASMVTRMRRIYAQGVSDSTYSSDLKKNAYRPAFSVTSSVAFQSANTTFQQLTGSAPAGSGTVPDAPVLVSVTAGDTELIIAFTAPTSDGGAAITDYEYSVDSGTTFVPASTTTSPFTIAGLTNGTTYPVVIRAINSVGSSVSSNSRSGTPVSTSPPLAPVLTGVSTKTDTTITVTFTQASNGSPSITNYKYSLDGGAYTALSPADAASPVTIGGLTKDTTYTIRLKAVNSNGDSPESDPITETTYDVVYEEFTTVGATTWTAPAGVTQIDYMVVGGGGGGGASYSDIEIIGSVPFQATSPGPTSYWINSAGSFYGYLFKGGSRYTASKPVRLTAPQIITPQSTTYAYNKWYDFEMIYTVSSGLPNATNVIYVQPQGTPSSTYSNNHSAGGGGGGGGNIRTSLINPLTKYTVTPGTTYNIYVGAGGAGGTGGAGVENPGADGESSYFDTIIATGGAGGKGSRVGFSTNGGGGFSSGNIMGGRGGAGGGRNGGSVINSEVYQWNTTVLRGTTGGSGVSINFDGTGSVLYCKGGDGGDANVAATSTTPANTGIGGEGTGSLVNSYADGIAGASGIVRIKYYITTQMFTTVGTTSWTAPAYVSNVSYLVVGGGGGAGNGYDNGGGGGGGGGMVRSGTISVTPGTVYTVTVGDGGVGGENIRSDRPGTAGSDSVFGSIVSLGGGLGKGSRTTPYTGAGVQQVLDPPAAPTGGSGSGGGAGGKGGGGAGGDGSANSGSTGGSGGTGLTSAITGSSVVYGAGGRGANSGSSNGGTNSGTSNTGTGGNGGGAGPSASVGGGNGQAGIVVLMY